MASKRQEAKKKKLFAAIDKYLSTGRVASVGGGWATVSPGEVQELHDITAMLVSMKYEADMDGDFPVDVNLLDRTKFQRLYLAPLPHLHNVETPEEELNYINRASANVRVSVELLDTAIRIMQLNHEHRKK